MSRILSGLDLAQRIQEHFPDAVVEALPQWVELAPHRLVSVCTHLRDEPELNLEFLVSLTAVDRLDYFEVVYHVQSIRRNHLAVLKVKALDHAKPQVPSVVAVWRGAHLQEREVFDLMGVHFEGHPDLRRVFLWEGFPGHPLRKDWLGMPGQRMPGLQRFPGEPGEAERGRG